MISKFFVVIFTLISSLGVSFAQCTISFDSFRAVDHITTNSIAWEGEYSRPITNGNKLSFIQRYNNSELSYSWVNIALPQRSITKIPLNLPVEIDLDRIEMHKSNVAYFPLEEISLFVTSGHIYVLEDSVGYLKINKDITIGTRSGEENLYVRGDYIYLIDKVQPGVLRTGGINIMKVNFVKGKIVKEKFIEDFGSFLYFHDRSFNYSVFTNECIVIYDREKDQVWRLDYNLRHLKQILNYPSAQEIFIDKNYLETQFGQVSLFDTVTSLSNSRKRLVRFCSYENYVLFFIEDFGARDSAHLNYEVMLSSDLINFSKVDVSEEDYSLLVQGVLVFEKEKLIILNSFGNVNLSQEGLKEEDIMKQLMFGKPYKLGIYDFSINL